MLLKPLKYGKCKTWYKKFTARSENTETGELQALWKGNCVTAWCYPASHFCTFTCNKKGLEGRQMGSTWTKSTTWHRTDWFQRQKDFLHKITPSVNCQPSTCQERFALDLVGLEGCVGPFTGRKLVLVHNNAQPHVKTTQDHILEIISSFAWYTFHWTDTKSNRGIRKLSDIDANGEYFAD